MADRYAHLKEFYADFARHDNGARRVAWRSYDGQIVRLQVLLEALRKVDYPASILDVGCGVGTLYGYLRDTERLGDYLGIDLLPDMIGRASASYPDGRFEVADLLDTPPKQRFDLVVCSGALNVLVDHHDHWVKRMLSAMWERADRAVAVNVQTTRAYRFNPVSKSDPDLYHAKVPTFLKWCEELTPWVAMRQDYLGSDAAFYLYKG